MLVAMCWIIPVVVLGGYCYIYYVRSVNEKIVDSVSSEIHYSASMAAGNIDAVLKVSRDVTYDRVVVDTYKEYLRGAGQSPALLNQKINSYLYNRTNSNPLISFSAIYFIEAPGQLYYHTEGNYTYVNRFQEEFMPEIRRFAAGLDGNIGFMMEGEHIFIIRNLIDTLPGRGYGTYGVTIFELNREEVFRDLEAGSLWSAGMVYSINDCIGSVDEDTQLYLDGALPEPDEGMTVTRRGEYYIFTGSVNKQNFTFSYAAKAPVDALNEQMQSYIWLMLLLSAVVLPLLLLTLVFFYRNFTRPLRSLVEAGRRLENGDFGYQVQESHAKSEFSYLVQTFNRMSMKLKKLFDQVYKEEIASRNARIMALQSQINPHFLNNTLELMNWQARFAGDTAVSKMIEALSTLMDAALDRSGRRVIPLSEELMCADAYLYIINQRFGKRLTVCKAVDDSLLNIRVPPLIIQPLLENAVEHGIEPVTKGNIEIRIYRKNGALYIEIVNDGVRLSPEDVYRINSLINGGDTEKPKSSTSLGIRNVNDRLRLIYGENSGLSIFSDKNGNTLSKVVIPITETEQ